MAISSRAQEESVVLLRQPVLLADRGISFSAKKATFQKQASSGAFFLILSVANVLVVSSAPPLQLFQSPEIEMILSVQRTFR